MKRALIIVVCVILIMGIAALIFAKNKKYSFEEITGVSKNEIESTSVDDKQGFDVNLFVENLCAWTYTKYRGDIGSTTQTYIEFYDKDGNLLFSVTDLGNRNLMEFNVNGKTRIYMGE